MCNRHERGQHQSLLSAWLQVPRSLCLTQLTLLAPESPIWFSSSDRCLFKASIALFHIQKRPCAKEAVGNSGSYGAKLGQNTAVLFACFVIKDPQEMVFHKLIKEAKLTIQISKVTKVDGPSFM